MQGGQVAVKRVSTGTGKRKSRLMEDLVWSKLCWLTALNKDLRVILTFD